eukprot:g39925.t1
MIRAEASGCAQLLPVGRALKCWYSVSNMVVIWSKLNLPGTVIDETAEDFGLVHYPEELSDVLGLRTVTPIFSLEFHTFLFEPRLHLDLSALAEPKPITG